VPRKAVTSEAKRFALNMKTTEQVRRRLEEAAGASGRSLTHEVEHRLEQSLQEEDLLRRYFGSDDAIELLKGISLIISYHSRQSGKPWWADKSTRDAIRAHFTAVFDAFDSIER
jgi:TraY domain-containing protein